MSNVCDGGCVPMGRRRRGGAGDGRQTRRLPPHPRAPTPNQPLLQTLGLPCAPTVGCIEAEHREGGTRTPTCAGTASMHNVPRRQLPFRLRPPHGGQHRPCRNLTDIDVFDIKALRTEPSSHRPYFSPPAPAVAFARRGSARVSPPILPAHSGSQGRRRHLTHTHEA